MYVTMWARKKVVLEEVKSHWESANWKSLLMMLSDAVIVCSQQKVVFFNPAACKLLEVATLQAPGSDPTLRPSSDFNFINVNVATTDMVGETGDVYRDTSPEAALLTKADEFLRGYMLKGEEACYEGKGTVCALW